MPNNRSPLAVLENGKTEKATSKTWIITKKELLKRNKTIETFTGLIWKMRKTAKIFTPIGNIRREHTISLIRRFMII